ncbi:MAG: DUF1153 domain-containing protein [Celeribacter sp.]|jgi:transposase-like protein
MFLKKVDGPRAVTLPDGSVMTLADLPPPDTRRWVASRKASVVRAVSHDLISAEFACRRYGLSEEELESWRRAVQRHGEQALKATSLQRFRDDSPPEVKPNRAADGQDAAPD